MLSGPDYEVSKITMDYEIDPTTVTLSEAKGLSRWASRCFAALSMTGLSPLRMPGPSCSFALSRPRAKPLHPWGRDNAL
jgi:hypothetical protein